MRIFVINLPHRADKRAEMLAQGEKYRLPLEILEAVNGNAIPDDELKKIAHDYPTCCMTKGVIGCSLSHLKIYKKVVDENLPIALILEDDAILHKDLAEVLCQIESIDRNEHPAVYLLSSHYYKTRPIRRLNGKYTLHEFKDGSQGHGYVVNRKAAESLYANLLPVKWEADKWYYFQQMKLASVYCVVPRVIDVNGVPEVSDLHAERALQNKQRRKYLNTLRHVVGIKQQVKKLMWKIFARPFSKKS